MEERDCLAPSGLRAEPAGVGERNDVPLVERCSSLLPVLDISVEQSGSDVLRQHNFIGSGQFKIIFALLIK